MKHLLVGLMTLAMIVMAVPAMAQHTPRENCDGATLPFTPLPILGAVATTNVPDPAGDYFKIQPTSWTPVGAYDFCGYLDTIYCTLVPLGSLLGDDIVAFSSLIQCINADINGPVNPDPEADLPITPNGIPDGQYELGLLAAVLNNTGNQYHADALDAFKYNYVNIQALVLEALYKENYLTLVMGAAPAIVTGLSGVLAAYTALGDATTNAAMDILLGLLEGIGVEVPIGGIAAITQNVPQLGPLGDADGDGFNNRREYNWFKTVYPGDPAAVIAAQLDPNQTPPTDQPDVVVRGGGKYEVGSRVELKAVFINTDGEGATFQWFKQGVEIADATGSSLLFLNTVQDDEGWYYVVATLPDKATELESAIVFITLVPVGSLPVAGGLGLALLAGACALAGAVGIRRRK